MQTNSKAVQDYYDDEVSYCYGCGRLNTHGLQIKSYWDGEEAICTYEPLPYHQAVPGYVYGGLIASLIDCHSTGAAAAAAYSKAGREMGSEPAFRYVTASLHVDYLRPTPIGEPLTLRASIKEMTRRKVVVLASLEVGGVVTARGETIVVQMPDQFLSKE